MITIAMQLGIIPLLEPRAKGRAHTADGKPPRVINKRIDRAEEIADRWAAITAICIEPTTKLELCEATGIKGGTLDDDLRKMVEKDLLRRRLHRSESLYWVPK